MVWVGGIMVSGVLAFSWRWTPAGSLWAEWVIAVCSWGPRSSPLDRHSGPLIRPHGEQNDCSRLDYFFIRVTICGIRSPRRRIIRRGTSMVPLDLSLGYGTNIVEGTAILFNVSQTLLGEMRTPWTLALGLSVNLDIHVHHHSHDDHEHHSDGDHEHHSHDDHGHHSHDDDDHDHHSHDDHGHHPHHDSPH